MPESFLASLAEQTEALREQGLFKSERLITGPQQADIDVRTDGSTAHVLNLCANNYLGLANHPEVIAAAHKALDDFGYGMASVRFICGTQTIHKELEARISAFLGTEDTILYPSCFDANGGLFETILGPDDAIISDALNHASIIDGIRLSKAQRFRYQHDDMQDLRTQLEASAGANGKLIVTDGVFSMDGTIADLETICALAEEFDALTMIDDCHATGFLGKTGRGTHEYREVMGRVDIITGTLGKALGGAAGGYVAASADAIAVLEQRGRPSLFSNALPATVAYSAHQAIEVIENDPSFVARLHANVATFRRGLADLGFDCTPSPTAIIPIMIGDEAEAIRKSKQLFDLGVMVIGFGFPVVPKGEARLRVQVSAALTDDHIQQAMDAFAKL